MADLANPTGRVATYAALPAKALDGEVYICDDNHEGFQLASGAWNFIGAEQLSGSGQEGSTSAQPTTGQSVPADSPEPGSATEEAAKAWTAEPKEYPLSLASTLLEILDYGFQRSAELDDAMAIVSWGDPASVTVTWPTADAKVANSIIYLRLQARPVGGASIGIWTSQDTGHVLPPPEPPVEPPPLASEPAVATA